MGANDNLQKAKLTKSDEFYTQLQDIEDELKHYRPHLEGKVIYCNCDDPAWSNFYKYFTLNFKFLGLKKLISTHYTKDLQTDPAYKKECVLDTSGNLVETTTDLFGDGDFRSDECVGLLKEADIVVTNPPFSLFREYVAQLIKYNKSFVIVGNQNAITYKEIFNLIKDNKLWQGYKCGDMSFKVPDHYEARETRYWQDESGQKWRSLGNACWFTNLTHKKRTEELILWREYNKNDYPTYDNYAAIEVNKVASIPIDYFGEMGVPITFLEKYNPSQFHIIGIDRQLIHALTGKVSRLYINGVELYARILIKRIANDENKS